VNLVTTYFRELRRGAWEGWNRFWFTPADPATLGLIRICAGLILFYTHLAWTPGLNEFFGQHGWLPPETIAQLPGHSTLMWSWFYWITSPAVLWIVHVAALVVFALLTIGLWSRPMSILAFLATVSYANRASLAQFGLDDTNAMLAMYLMVGPSGAAYSVDRWLKRRKSGGALAIEPLIGANVAIRLFQVHLCIVYLFSGLGKIVGAVWWDGRAIWGVIANLEYQSFDLTWLSAHPWIIALLTHVTVFWETFYCALVWPRLTRPLVIAMAAGVHLGIGAFFGMWTFGLAMLTANLAFVSPWVVRRVIDRQPAEAARVELSAPSQATAAERRAKMRRAAKRQPV
jgi:Vitamin K-dependent gamma-carboxylase